MKLETANYFRGQLKVQEMAFVLIGIFMLFVIAGLFYFSIRFSSLEGDVKDNRADEARALVITITGLPEISWKGCSSCVDLDKAFVLKNQKAYNEFWELDYLMIEKIYPESDKLECNRQNYPDCSKITLIDTKEIGTPAWAFVSLCRYDSDKRGELCSLGRIYASGRAIS